MSNSGSRGHKGGGLRKALNYGRESNLEELEELDEDTKPKDEFKFNAPPKAAAAEKKYGKQIGFADDDLDELEDSPVKPSAVSNSW